MKFTRNILAIDPAAEANRIVHSLRQQVHQVLRRHGATVGISGGVDSAVVCALCVRAFGSDRVAAVIMPDKDSNPLSEKLARQLAQEFGLQPIFEDVSPALEGFGCYCRRDEAIRRIFAEYDPAHGYKAKIVLPQNLLQDNTLNTFCLTVITPSG